MASELQKHTLLLFQGDYGLIQDLHPDIGAAIIIRKLVRSYIQKLQEGDRVPSLLEGINL